MKITKRQLRQLIREVGSPDRVPLTGEDTEYDNPAVDHGAQWIGANHDRMLVDDLVTAMKSGRVSAEALDDGEDGGMKREGKGEI